MPFLTYTADGKIRYAYTSNMIVGPVASLSSNTTLTTAHYIALVSATCTITLPDAIANPGRQYQIKNIGVTATVTVDTTSSQTIDGSLTKTIPYLNNMTVVSDGSNWWVL